MSRHYRSWGYAPDPQQAGQAPAWRDSVPLPGNGQGLPFGNGRSYGDSCLNSGGTLIDARQLNHFIAFDEHTGLLTCEAGVLFADIIQTCLPRGWFLPVAPGTRYITVGGAIANDVHGKNHHTQGTFGRHVVQFELQRSDGSCLICSSTQNTGLFKATLGGLGLTGFITWAQIQLRPVHSDRMDTHTRSFANLSEFYALSAASQHEYEYTVAWLDCSTNGTGFGRGIFFAADHAQGDKQSLDPVAMKVPAPRRLIPVNLPPQWLNSLTVRAFNTLYYHKNRLFAGPSQGRLHPYFYPLDSLHNWYRIYGRPGFYQYQFCLPIDKKDELESLLRLITRSGMASFLAVLKEFGDVPSPGLLSFPMPGYCLALDFPDKGEKTRALLASLEQRVCKAGGRAYPAKDRLMSAAAFQQYYPHFSQFKPFIDPGMSSDFWRRVMPNE